MQFRAHNAGDLRIIRKFAFWPTRIDGMYVWLEMYKQHQSFKETPITIFGNGIWIDTYKERKHKCVP